MTPLVTVWRHERVKGWDGTAALRSAEVAKFPTRPLLDVLQNTYTFDAHFVPYHVPGMAAIPRINKAALPVLASMGLRLRFDVLVIDVDDPAAHRENRPASEAWRERQAALRDNLPEALWSGMGWYETRGGYRMLWVPPAPLSEKTYVQWHAGLRADLGTEGIVCDDRTIDWGRCYRLPFVTRAGTLQEYAHDFDGLSEEMLWRPRASLKAANGSSIPRELLVGIEDVRAPFELPEIIGKGQRDDLLTRYAGKARYAGMGESELLDLLRTTNAARCRPPLADEQLQKIAHSVAGYAPGQILSQTQAIAAEHAAGVETAPNTFTFTLGSDTELATKTVELLEDGGPTLVADLGHLWRYNDDSGCWERIFPDVVGRVTMSFDGAMIHNGKDRDGRLRLKPLKVQSGMVRGAYALALAQRSIYNFFVDAPHGVSMQNGFVTVEVGELVVQEKSPEHRATFGLPYRYVEGSRPERFLQMLRGCWRGDSDLEGKIEALREWLGATIVGHATSFEMGLVLVGEGANGKSTLQRIVKAIFPPETVTAVAPQAMGNEYRRALLAQSRLNVVSEMPEADILDSTSVKAMFSGDELDAREIREAPFKFRPRAGQLFATNTLPAVRDTTHGFWRKWLILEFNRRFEEDEQDKGLAARIIDSELSEIVSWALDGLPLLFARNGYPQTNEMRAALKEWRTSSNPVAAWIEEAVDLEASEDVNAFVSASVVYQRYCTWAIENGHKGQLSKNSLGRRLTSLGIARTVSSGGSKGYRAVLRPILGMG